MIKKTISHILIILVIIVVFFSLITSVYAECVSFDPTMPTTGGVDCASPGPDGNGRDASGNTGCIGTCSLGPVCSKKTKNNCTMPPYTSWSWYPNGNILPSDLNTSIATISGNSYPGQILTAGARIPAGSSIASYQWQKTTGGTYTPIPGAVSETYTIPSDTPLGNHIRVQETISGSVAGLLISNPVNVTRNPSILPLGDPCVLNPSGCSSPSIDADTTYTPLAPLPEFPTVSCIKGTPQCVCDNNDVCKKTIFNTTDTNSFGNYLNIMIKLIIGLIAVSAVVMIFIGGIEYMTSEVISSKEHGKERIRGAILGLLLALGAYAILNTINPDLLKTDLVGLQKVPINVDILGDTNVPVGVVTGLPAGTLCTAGMSNIPDMVSSFTGKMTYEMGAKGIPGPNNTIKFDCSGFVSYILRCANPNSINGGTTTLFSGTPEITLISGSTVNFTSGQTTLRAGDLLGWMPGEAPAPYNQFGHVLIYVGNGNVIADSHGGSSIGDALGQFSLDTYRHKDLIKHLKRP